MATRRTVALLGLAAMSLTACGSSSGERADSADSGFEERTIIHSTYIAEGHPNSLQVKDWMAEVTERTDGAVTFEENYAGALCPALESLDCVADGRADFGSVTPPYSPTLLATSNIDTMPFLVDSPQALANAWRTFLRDDVIEGEFERAGLKAVYGSPLASVVLGTKQPIEDVSDIGELSIRAIGQLGRSIEPLGGDVVANGADELYESLQRGVIDGYVTTPDTVLAFNLQEVTDYFYDFSAHVGATSIQGYAMNLDVWNDLEPELQQIMLEVGEEVAGRTMVDYIDPYVETACQTFVDSSNGFFELTDETGWADSVRDSLLADFLETEGVDADAVERYTSLLEEASAEIGDDYRTTGDICLAAMEDK